MYPMPSYRPVCENCNVCEPVVFLGNRALCRECAQDEYQRVVDELEALRKKLEEK